MPETTQSGSKSVRTVCDPNCQATPRCGILAHVEEGRIVRIEAGSFPLPEYDRRICLMGASRLEYQYHKDRLRHPVKRIGARGAGQWQRIGWDEAFDLIAGNFRAVAAKHAARAVAIINGSGNVGVLTRGAPYRFASGLHRHLAHPPRAQAASITAFPRDWSTPSACAPPPTSDRVATSLPMR